MKHLMLILMVLPIVCASNVELLNTDPYPLQAGEFGKMRIKLLDTIHYEGDDFDTKTVSVTFVDSSAIKLVDEAKRTRTFTLKGKHSEDFYQLIEYDVLVGSVPNGSVEVAFRLDGTDTRYVSVPVEDENVAFDVGNIKSMPKHLYPEADDVKLEVQVANVGDDTAKNVIASLSSPALESASSFSNRYGLGRIESSQAAIAEFYVDVPDVAPGSKELTLHLSYSEDDEPRQVSFDVPFVVLGKPQFQIEALNAPRVMQGESSALKLKVTNTGQQEAEEVAVDVIKDSNVLLEFDRYIDFVGNLDPGQSGEVYLPFSAAKDASVKENPIELSIRYVFNNEVHTESLKQQIQVTERNQTVLENKALMGVVVSLIIIGTIVYSLMHK
ncbi:MAG: COG1361 S-layer family protein [Nanobdellota archaeon]